MLGIIAGLAGGDSEVREGREMSEKCCENVMTYVGNWPRSHQCTRNAVVIREGKPYCKQHDPDAVKARQDARKVKWDAEMERDKAHWDRRRAEAQACQGVATEDLRPGMVKELLEMLRQLAE